MLLGMYDFYQCFGHKPIQLISHQMPPVKLSTMHLCHPSVTKKELTHSVQKTEDK